MYYSHKYLILRVLKEAIEKEKSVISKADINREDIIKKDMNPDIMRQILWHLNLKKEILEDKLSSI